MRCSQCLSENIKVLESRAHQDGRAIRRRRKCQDCDYRFTTYEREEEVQIRVEKKDGRFEDFSRDKILRSLQIPVKKDPLNPPSLIVSFQGWRGSFKIRLTVVLLVDGSETF